MNRLLKQLTIYNNQTSNEQLAEWCSAMDEQVHKLSEKEQSYYYFLISEVMAVKMSDIDGAFQFLKNVNVSSELLAYEYKLHDIYYKYLEGDYTIALKELQLIEVNAENSRHIKKICIDFWKRVIPSQYSRTSKALKGSKQQFQQFYIKALQLERTDRLREAQDIHIQLFKDHSHRDSTIEYELAKNIILLDTKTSGLKKEAIAEYKSIVNTYERNLSNANYYESKIQFLKKILQFIDPQNEGEDLLVDYGLMKSFMISNIQKALQDVQDKQTKGKLQLLLYDLEDESQSQRNNQICYKFLGQKRYQQLLRNVQQNSSNGKKKKSKIKQTAIKPELASRLRPESTSRVRPEITPTVKGSNIKLTKSYMGEELDSEFRGSNMIKVNTNSSGHEQRYFYFKSNFKSTLKLYYCSKKGKESPDDDEYYRLKGFKKFQVGKVSRAFKRNECDQFPEDQCITLKISGEDDVERNFYVADREDFQNWSNLFQSLVVAKEKGEFNTKKTKLFL